MRIPTACTIDSWINTLEDYTDIHVGEEIYTTINFTDELRYVSVTPRVGGWLGVVGVVEIRLV